MSVSAYIDIQGYSGLEKDYITPKEVAVAFSDGALKHYHIKPVQTFNTLDARKKKIVFWATRIYHGLAYGSGILTKEAFENELRTDIAHCSKIYTKGKQKQKYLVRVLGSAVLDLGHQGCPSIRTAYSTDCQLHLCSDKRCAEEGAKFQRAWHEHANSAKISAENKQTGEEAAPRRGLPGGSTSTEVQEAGSDRG